MIFINRGADDARLAKLGHFHMINNTSASENDDSIGDFEEVGGFGADDDDGFTLIGGSADDIPDIGFGGDVDPLERFVEEEDIGVGCEFARQEDFLPSSAA